MKVTQAAADMISNSILKFMHSEAIFNFAFWAGSA